MEQMSLEQAAVKGQELCIEHGIHKRQGERDMKKKCSIKETYHFKNEKQNALQTLMETMLLTHTNHILMTSEAEFVLHPPLMKQDG